MSSAGFSVPALQLHKVLQGAVNRVREHQEADWETEKSKRDAYMRQLTALIPTAATGADIEAINEEIARVQGEPREKQFKPRLIKTPSYAAPKAGAGAGAGGAGAASGQPATPPFDFREVVAAITGAPTRSGMPDVPSAQGGPPESVGALPPDFAAIIGAGGGAGPGASAGAVPSIPPVGAGTLGGVLGGRVEPTPGRNVPEPSPLVGTLPGTPSPVSMGAATPQMPSPSPSPPSTPALPTLPAVPPSPFMGIRERAELPYQLNEQYGMNRSGKPVGGSAGKPLLTVKDLVSAARGGLEIVPDPTSPTGFAVVPRAQEDLSLTQRSKLATDASRIETDAARRRSMSVRDRLAEDRPDLMRELTQMRIDAAAMRSDVRERSRDLRDTGFVAGRYEKSVSAFREMARSLSQLEAMIGEATGPGDYGAIIQFVHSLDDTAAREGEVAMARSAASLANRLEGLFARWREGDLFTDDMRKEFVSAARASNSAFQAHRKEIDEQYGVIADEYGLDRRMIGIPGAARTTASGSSGAGARSGARSGSSGSVERWERDPATGKLRKVK